MLRKFPLLVFAVLLIVVSICTVTANATPGKSSSCTGCHDQDPKVTASITFNGCSGDIASYSISVSDTYDAGEGWAVFDSSGKILSGYAPGSFTVDAGQSYDVYGVSDGSGRGGADVVVINPDCGTPCTDADGDKYSPDGGACGPTDCNDDDPGVHPGAPEICTDGVDNNCNGLVDALDSKAVDCPLQCTDEDIDGYAIEGGLCGPIDCDDTLALSNPGQPEDCYDTYDNDCDGLIDGADTDCGGCVFTGREKGKKCSDGIDNDCDDLLDNDDPDCGATNSGPAEICDDGIDNDGDKKIDCSDKKDCGKNPVCKN
jgi:hypothetical protein